MPEGAPLLPQRARGRAVRDRSKKIEVTRKDLEAALELFREIVGIWVTANNHTHLEDHRIDRTTNIPLPLPYRQ
jgi:hypothetical protein